MYLPYLGMYLPSVVPVILSFFKSILAVIFT